MMSEGINLKYVVRALRLIFWGGLICVIDITVSQTVNGSGWKFDFLNDFVGMVMIAVGVFRLAVYPVSDTYGKVMSFARVVSVLNCISALDDHFIYSRPDVVLLADSVLGIAVVVGIVLFCWAMQKLCIYAELHRSCRSWVTTMWMFVVVYLIPLGLFYAASSIAILTGDSFNINLGPAFLVVVVIFVIPLIHFFVSTSRMIRESRTVA